MILTIDIGNSNIVSVVYDGEKRLLDDRCETVRQNSYNIQSLIFTKIRKVLNLENEKLEFVVLSCVVPSIQKSVIRALEDVFKCEVKTFNYATIKDMKIEMENPLVVGSDLLATNAGAWFKYKEACIICDLGSASKIMYIDENFVFTGGIIMPGIYFQAKSLHDMIPQLPIIDIELPKSVLGHDTESCIQSGIINGTYQAILGLSREIEEKAGRKCRKILTGGLAKIYLEGDIDEFIYDEFLLNDGMNYIARNYMMKENGIK